MAPVDEVGSVGSPAFELALSRQAFQAPFLLRHDFMGSDNSVVQFRTPVARVRQELALLNDYLTQEPLVETEFLVLHCEQLLSFAKEADWGARAADQQGA